MKTNTILEIKDTTIIKGIAILLIICHNFFHWLKPIMGENEFSFNLEFSQNFIESLISNPLNFLQYILAFAGHYGLQLFIFISGYGLTVRYAYKVYSYKGFIKKRLVKLYPVFTIALLGLLVYKFIIFNNELNSEVFIDFILRYTLLANLIPKEVFVLNGPFWFYSMIVQLYLLFPLLLFIIKKNIKYLYLIAVLTFLIVLVFNQHLSGLNFSLFYNFIGHLPVFVFGIVYAFKGDLINKHLKWMSFVAIIILGLSIYNIYFWHLSYLAFLVLFLSVHLFLKKIRFPKVLSQFIVFTGGLSYYLFAVHGFLRTPWVYLANKADSDIFNHLFLLVFLTISFGVAVFTRKIEYYYLHLFKNKKQL
jgi:peptidoglycan/LPS O-acetylase OafA/YrhL